MNVVPHCRRPAPASPNEEIRLQRRVYASTHAYVPFAGVQSIMRNDPERLFRDPADNLGEVVHSRELEIHAGPVPVHDRFTIEIGQLEVYPDDHFCRLHLTCRGDRHHLVLPDVDAVIDASDAGDDRTQLEVVGHYSPPMGALGALEDALIGHRAVHEAMTLVVADLAAALQAALTPVDTAEPLPHATTPTSDEEVVAERQYAAR
jgi:hypothetical protein